MLIARDVNHGVFYFSLLVFAQSSSDTTNITVPAAAAISSILIYTIIFYASLGIIFAGTILIQSQEGAM